jgi:predicted DNA-binding mobile mystery protein A
MTKNSRALVRRQVSQKLKPWQKLVNEPRPAKGWLRAIRESLGMDAIDLARRMGIRPATLHQYEVSEQEGTISLKTLRRAAESMDAVLVYALVPRSDIEGTLKKRARTLADDMLGRVGHSMALESQAVEGDEQRRQAEALVEQLLSNPRKLWK